MSDTEAGKAIADKLGGAAGTHRVNIGRVYRNLAA